MRFGSGPSPPASANAPISIPAGQATFALGGGAACASPCADEAGEDLGPDAWLSGSIAQANQIAGLRAFLYAGGRLGAGEAALTGDPLTRELDRYDELLSSGGSLPVYAAADEPGRRRRQPERARCDPLLPHAGRLDRRRARPAPPAGSAAYAFDSTGAGGTVRVIVVDYSSGSLSLGGAVQLQWLAAELAAAKQAGIPAIVVGGDDIAERERQTRRPTRARSRRYCSQAAPRRTCSTTPRRRTSPPRSARAATRSPCSAPARSAMCPCRTRSTSTTTWAPAVSCSSASTPRSAIR